MPQKRIEFEGQIHEFPADFTDADIAKALRSVSTGAVEKARERDARMGMSAAPPPNVFSVVADMLEGDTGIVGGAAKNVLGLVTGAGKLAREYIPGVAKLDDLVRPAIVDTTVRTPGEKLGSAGAEIASYAIPAGSAEKLTASVARNAGPAIKVLARAGGQATVAGAHAAAREGDLNAATVPAIIAGGVPIGGAVLRKTAEQTLYPAVRSAVAPGGILDDFFANVGMRPSNRAVAGQTAENLDEALRQVREVGLTGNRGDWDKIAKWLESRRDQFAEARQGMRDAGLATEPMRQAATQLRAEEDLLHRLSEELAKYHPETGFSPFGTGGLGYLFGGPKTGVPMAIVEAVRKRFPAWSAAQLDRGASLLMQPAAPAAASALADELMRREKDGR
jgi:hypothetical protein